MLLTVEHVSKRYESITGVEVPPVLDEVSLQLDQGQSLAIVGPSGSGKSTLLNIIGGLDRPTSGRVLLNDQDLATLSDNQLAKVRNNSIGLVFQAHHLLPQCTVLENVVVPVLAQASRVSNEVQSRAKQLLDRVGLSHRLTHRPGQLSGGERQRVAVVRALIRQPVLLLADEPTGSLDRAAAENLTALLLEINHEDQIALIVVTHSPAMANKMGSQLNLTDGQLGPLNQPAESIL